MSLVTLVVRLRDEFSAKVPAIIDGIDKIDRRGRGSGSGSGGKPGTPGVGPGAGGGISAKKMLGLGAVAAGLTVAAGKIERSMQSITQSIAKTAAFDHELKGLGQIGNLSDERLSTVRKTLLDLSAQFGRTGEEMLKGIFAPIVASGVDDVLAEKLLAPFARVAISRDAQFADVSNAGIALVKNLKIGEKEIESVFDGLVAAGDQGRFELSDMAKHFGNVASAAAEAGMQGKGAAFELAAALQVAREGAGDTSQAANNLVNLLRKIQSPQTVASFKKIGVDIKQAIADGVADGRSPLETIILETRKALDADPRLALSNLFGDMQVQAALGPLIREFDLFKKIMKEASEATGTVERGFRAMSSTLQADMDRLDASIDRRQKTWDKLVEPFMKMRTKLLTAFNDWLTSLTTRFPRLATGIGVAGLAFGELATAISNVWPTLLGVASSLAIGKIIGLGRVAISVGRAFGRFGAMIARGLGGAFFWLLRYPAAILAGVMQGFVQGLAPLAARLAPLFARLGPGILGGLAALGPLLVRGIGMLARLFMGPAGWVLIAGQLAWSFREEIGSTLSSIASWFQGRFQSLFGDISLADIGAKLMQSLLDGLKRAADSVIGWASGFVGRLKGLFSFSASPTITPQGGTSPPAAIPQSYRPTGLTPAPSRQASVTFNNTFTVNGGADPEGAARRILAALDRQRQAGLYDGALA